MRNIVLAAIAAFGFGVFYLGPVDIAEAARKCLNCDQPTAVQRGQKIPVWKVAYCVVGNPGSYRKIDCKSPKAVHRTPLGTMGVCFIGTDRKVHWDYQREVHVARPFINHRINGRWQPDWQDARPY